MLLQIVKTTIVPMFMVNQILSLTLDVKVKVRDFIAGFENV